MVFPVTFVLPLYLGSALNPVNSSMIATALVPIAAFAHVSVGRTAVLVTAVYLASSVAQPTAGKLAEVFGPRRILVTGCAVVLAGGLVGASANGLIALIVARVLIGIGTSACYPSGMLQISLRAESAGLTEPPGGVLGGLQIAGTAMTALGLPLGGVLVDTWGWRSTFLVNVPVAALTFGAALLWLPRDRAVTGMHGPRAVLSRIDFAGICGFGGAMIALLVFLFSLPRLDWIALGIAVVLGVGLVLWELRAASPFVDVRLLASNGALSRTYLRMALVALCVYTVLYGVTQWVQDGRHVSSLEAGLLLLPMSVLSAVVMRPVTARNLVRGPLVVTAAACLVPSAGVLLLTTGTPLVWIVVITLFFGLALGMSAANQTMLYVQVPAEQMGTAAGLFRTFTYVGSIASSAVINIAFGTRADDSGLHVIGVVMIVMSGIAVLITVLDRSVMRLARVR